MTCEWFANDAVFLEWPEKLPTLKIRFLVGGLKNLNCLIGLTNNDNVVNLNFEITRLI